MTDILLTIPYFFDDEFDPVLHQDGTHTHILWVIPLHRSERLFVRERGELALLELFSDREVDTSDLQRSPVV